jgi:hypothetical protein
MIGKDLAVHANIFCLSAGQKTVTPSNQLCGAIASCTNERRVANYSVADGAPCCVSLFFLGRSPTSSQ